MKQQRLQLKIQGAVQGVGFRPFIYRLATELGLVGWVNNSSQGVSIEVEGKRANLDTFLTRLAVEKPPRSQIQNIEITWLEKVGYTNFQIRPSISGEKTTAVLPDFATCPDCLREIFDPQNRRYRYPFTNCTNCGPRYTIIEALPYDRNYTTMASFQMCPACQSEYENLLDRRFHAQPNACLHCGPHLEWWDRRGEILAINNQALLAAGEAIQGGKIVAIKGLGGFHLTVDGRNCTAVATLRHRKRRPDKPFALMYPSLELIKTDCEVTPLEEQLLLSPEAPIVLLKKKQQQNKKKENLSSQIAPENPYLGVMLPSTPLHHLLMAELGFPIVATSGNLSNEPICIDEREALQRLGQIADRFLIHNRPIARPVDDSVVRIIGQQTTILRRARGYAPLPITVRIPKPKETKKSTDNTSLFPPILAVGGHLKNTVALSRQNQVFISQHIGDLATAAAWEAFQSVMVSLKRLYEFEPAMIACDAHPDYLSTQFALARGLPVVRVQHHYAHVLSCMAEYDLEPPVLGVAWDGTGYGGDGTIWGGEFLGITAENYQRLAHFRPFQLPGGEWAVKESRRVALSLLHELRINLENLPEICLLRAFSPEELANLRLMLSRNLNCPQTSSVGRLFDGVASLVGLCQQGSFEGQAAMALEFAIADFETEESYPLALLSSQMPMVVDWGEAIAGILRDLAAKLPLCQISAKFHNTLVEAIVAVAKQTGERQVVLTGGCFQNKYLTERAIQRLRQENCQPYWHCRIPPNDGGLALGQMMAVLREG